LSHDGQWSAAACEIRKSITMPKSPSLPPEKAFDQIADIFLTDSDSSNGEAGGLAQAASHGKRSSFPNLSLTSGLIDDDNIEIDDVIEGDSSLAAATTAGGLDGVSFSNEKGVGVKSRRSDGGGFRQPVVSLILACHLPVRGRLWLKQIARVSAETGGATFFVQTNSEMEVSAELFSGRGACGSESKDVAWSEVLNIPPSKTLRESAETAMSAGAVDQWLIHVEREDDFVYLSELDEIAPQRVILATSADPAAMVGVYRTLKRVAGVLHSETEIGLIFVGASQESAEAAFSRIRSATRGFLKREVMQLGVLQRMRPIRATHLGDFFRESQGESETALLPWICGEIYSGMADAEARSAAGEREDELSLREVDRSADDAEVPGIRGVREYENGSAPRRSTENEFEQTDRESNQVERDLIGEGPPALSSLIPGLVDLVVRSPKAPDVELAMDVEGCIHALLSEQMGHGADRHPVEELVKACDWIESHSSIFALLRTCPVAPELIYGGADRGVRTKCHLFTSQPRRYRGMMDGRFRIHLFARKSEAMVEVGDWVSAPVN